MTPDLTGAACAETHDPELWFPGKGQSILAPILICRECPVRDECLSVAMQYPVSGVWGGTSEDERRRIARGRGQNYNETSGNTEAERRGIKPQSIRRQELRDGAPRMRPNNEPGSAEARRQEALRLAAAGVNRQSIAAVIGVSARAVRSYLAELDEAAS